jgi:hypothetical protein
MSPLKFALLALRPKLAEAAQAVVDGWEQDSEGFDEELGTGGACDRVADAMSQVLASNLPEVSVETGGQDGDDHAFLLVSYNGETFSVDIPSSVYETGAGYSWRKVAGASITYDDVLVWNVGNPRAGGSVWLTRR